MKNITLANHEIIILDLSYVTLTVNKILATAKKLH